jgi:hypothetical protein
MPPHPPHPPQKNAHVQAVITYKFETFGRRVMLLQLTVFAAW